MMDIRYIAQATNDIFRVLSGKLEPTARDLQDAFAIGCNALKRLADDKDFINDLMTVATYQHQNAATFKDAVTDVKHFVERFLAREKELLTKAGISKEAVGALIKQAEALRDDIKDRESDPEEMPVNINKFRNEVCNTAEALRNGVIGQEERNQKRSFLIKVGYVLGGATIIGINASTIAVTYGLSQVGIAISGAVGSTIMGAAMGEQKPMAVA
jgi:hypothetical protein